MVEILHLNHPSLIKRVLEIAGREVEPADICPTKEDLDKLYEMCPDLTGDGTAIGPGDDGNCQSWRNDPGWWKALVDKYGR